MTPADKPDLPQTPASNLPSWDECAIRVHNSEYIAKRVADGGYGAEHDSKLASELHRFIYEYDDVDAYRSAWFRHRLELLLADERRKALEDAAELCDAKFNKMAAGGFPREASASRALAKEIRALLDRKEPTT